MRKLLIALLAACLSLGFAAGTYAADDTKKEATKKDDDKKKKAKKDELKK
jgi:pentapeptide MXKDX repeat protein